MFTPAQVLLQKAASLRKAADRAEKAAYALDAKATLPEPEEAPALLASTENPFLDDPKPLAEEALEELEPLEEVEAQDGN